LQAEWLDGIEQQTWSSVEIHGDDNVMGSFVRLVGVRQKGQVSVR
jgi:hypothetical protein